MGDNPSALGTRAGIGRATLSAAFKRESKGGSGLSSEVGRTLADFASVSLDWLLTGKGSPSTTAEGPSDSAALPPGPAHEAIAELVALGTDKRRAEEIIGRIVVTQGPLNGARLLSLALLDIGALRADGILVIDTQADPRRAGRTISDLQRNAIPAKKPALR